MPSAAGWKTSDPGRITTSTPKKPTVTAARRFQPICSPSMGRASSVTKNGDMKEMEEALASGTSFTEKKKKVVDASNSKERETCTPGLRLFSTLSP